MSRPPRASLSMYRRLGVLGYFEYLADVNGLTDHPQLYSGPQPVSNHDVEDRILALLSPAGPPPSTPSPKFDPKRRLLKKIHSLNLSKNMTLGHSLNSKKRRKSVTYRPMEPRLKLRYV